MSDSNSAITQRAYRITDALNRDPGLGAAFAGHMARIFGPEKYAMAKELGGDMLPMLAATALACQELSQGFETPEPDLPANMAMAYHAMENTAMREMDADAFKEKPRGRNMAANDSNRSVVPPVRTKAWNLRVREPGGSGKSRAND